MANEEHLKVLRQGVQEWNNWRQDHPGVAPDLSGADLKSLDLTNVNFDGADLSDANLCYAGLGFADFTRAQMNRANLSGAHVSSAWCIETDLSDACLIGTYLSSAQLLGTRLVGAELGRACFVRAKAHRADFSGANLNWADFSGADLSWARFREANLLEANFNFARLREADLEEAKLKRTVLADVDLRGTLGLESCVHKGPSVLDHGTLARSGVLPVTFLRGVGLPDVLIELQPRLSGDALKFCSCFISYSSGDQEFVEQLYSHLQDRGVRCWFAPHDMPIGAKMLDTVVQAISAHDKLLLVLSERSDRSGWVEDEVTKAFAEERRRETTVLFPIRIDDAVMGCEKAWAAKIRDDRHIGDFTNWKDHDAYQKAFERLLRDLSRKPESSEG